MKNTKRKVGRPKKKNKITDIPEYKLWVELKRRCFPGKNRTTTQEISGITMSPEWLDFETFYKDVGSKPTPESKFIRKDPLGDYTKDNCHWSEDNPPRRDTRYIIYHGERRLFTELCKEKGINVKTAHSRFKAGLDNDGIFDKPVRQYKNKKR
jgi:hypothetical protein